MLRVARYLVVVVAVPMVGLSRSASAQQGPLSLAQVAELVSRKVNTSQILTITRSHCLREVADSQHTRGLLFQSGDPALVAGLREACYIGSALEVTADQPGGTVRVRGTAVGPAPWRAPVSPSRIAIALERGVWSKDTSVDVREGQYVVVTFHVPVDTEPVPPAKSPAQLAALAADTAVFTPRSPRPIAPVRPTGHSTVAGTLIGALVGGAAGAGVGYAACKTTSPVEAPSQLGGYNSSHTTTTSVNGGCVAGAGGGGLVVGGLVGNLISRAQYGGRLRRYQHDSLAYIGTLAAWQQQYSADSATEISRKRQQYHDERAKADRAAQIVQLNADARAHNARLTRTEIVVLAARQLPRAGGPSQ